MFFCNGHNEKTFHQFLQNPLQPKSKFSGERLIFVFAAFLFNLIRQICLWFTGDHVRHAEIECSAYLKSVFGIMSWKKSNEHEMIL